MAQAEERDLTQVVGERVEVETVQRLELGVRHPARSMVHGGDELERRQGR